MTIGCKQCGRCCMNIALKFNAEIPTEVRHYYQTIGCRFVGDILFIPFTCQHLLPANENGQYKCAIYQKRPQACKDFTGKKNDIHGREYAIFEGCTND